MDLKRLLKTPIYFKLVKFFAENPASIDTPRGLAAWTGEGKQDVKKAVLKLSNLKILTAHKVSSTTGYSYTTDGNIAKKVSSILKKLKRETAKDNG